MEAAVCGNLEDAEGRDRGSSTAIRRLISSNSWFFEGTVDFAVVQYQQLSPNDRLQGSNKHPSERHAES